MYQSKKNSVPLFYKPTKKYVVWFFMRVKPLLAMTMYKSHSVSFGTIPGPILKKILDRQWSNPIG